MCHERIGAGVIIVANAAFHKGHTSVERKIRFLHDTIRAFMKYDETTQKQTIEYAIDGHIVCEAFWSRAYFADYKDACRAIIMVLRRINTDYYSIENAVNRQKSLKTKQAIAWMSAFIDSTAQYYPTKLRRFLPSTYTYATIYRRYEMDMASTYGHRRMTICQATFRHVLLTTFSDVEIGVKQNGFSKCAFCVALKELYANATDNHTRRYIEKILDDHRCFAV